jgi:hypothetical protein
VFIATPNATVPLPVPDAPLVTVNHAAFALAVHAQLFAEAGDRDRARTAGVSDVLGLRRDRDRASRGLRDRERFPAAAIVALRVLLPVLAANVYLTVPLPVPDLRT